MSTARPSPSSGNRSGSNGGSGANGTDGADGAGLRARLRRRRAAKKRRIATMSRGRRLLRRFAVAGTWLLAMFTALLVALVVLFYTLSNVPRPESLPLPQVATIEYADGSTMAKIGTVNRTTVTLDQVPEQVRWDVLAAEDRNFYSEPGVSIRGTLRAALADVTGGDTQGGSGITQQYAKNAYLSDSRTLSRKLKELMIAVKLSREYSKNEILGFYLNTVYFGRGAYGIQAAAQTYFGKDVGKLDVAQGAVLAALLRAPSYYDPANNPAEARARWKYVLDGMVATHHLPAAQEAALSYPKVAPPNDAQLGASGPTALIVHQVIDELEAHGISAAEINTRGLTVRTTIDRTAQADAQKAITQTFSNLTSQQRNFKNALVAISPGSGAVLAYYGGPNAKGYNGKIDNFDYAGIGTRPPGSSFKPYTLATVLTQTVDKTRGKQRLTISSYVDGSFCVTIEGRRICNDPGDSGVSSSSVSIRAAMKYSLNTTFDQLAVQAGPDNVAATAHAAGIPKTDPNGNPLLVDRNGHTGFDIGIGGYPVTPLDQAVGFATFANNGIRNGAYFVTTVTDASGATVYQHKSAGTRTIDLKVANDVTLSLEPIAAYSNDPLSGGRVSAAKTGTEGITHGPDTGQNSDAWMVGYTPRVSVAVWAGSGDSTHAIYNGSGGQEYGADLPGKTWAMFMDTYLSGTPELPMATTQLVTGGINTARVPTYTPSPSPTPSTSQKPSPTFTIKTTFSSAPPPPPSTSSSAPVPPPPPPTTPSPPPTTCTPSLLGPPCP
ncbi:MAG: transglycosylase domain-containing protein [Jatrophihabitantaceae bacterium]